MERLRESDNLVALCREVGISRQLLCINGGTGWMRREQAKLDPTVVKEQQLRQEEVAKLKQGSLHQASRIVR